MKSLVNYINDYINENQEEQKYIISEESNGTRRSSQGTVEEFYEVLSEILIQYADDDDMWKKVKQHFKKNKSIYKAIKYYDKWRDLLGISDAIDAKYSTQLGRNRIEADVKKYDKELSEKLLNDI